MELAFLQLPKVGIVVPSRGGLDYINPYAWCRYHVCYSKTSWLPCYVVIRVAMGP